MPSVKIARKSTLTDMTPFVDIAFLILSFFIMATKFKPQEPIEITTPNSVSSDILPTDNAVMTLIDKDSKVYFSVLSEKDQEIYDKIIQEINTKNNLGLTPAEMANYRKTPMIGVPFANLKQVLGMTPEQQKNLKQPGIPVDTANNQLVQWIAASKNAFAGKTLKFLIKGDGVSKFPSFNGVIEALKKNDENKYNLVTAPEDIPGGTELSRQSKSKK